MQKQRNFPFYVHGEEDFSHFLYLMAWTRSGVERYEAAHSLLIENNSYKVLFKSDRKIEACIVIGSVFLREKMSKL